MKLPKSKKPKGRSQKHFLPSGRLNPSEELIERFRASRMFKGVSTRKRGSHEIEQDANAQLLQKLNSIFMEELNESHEREDKLNAETLLALNSIGGLNTSTNVGADQSEVVERAESVRLQSLTEKYFANASNGVRSSRPSKASLPGHDELSGVPSNIGIDSHANINLIRVNASNKEKYFPFGCTKSTAAVSWAGGGSKTLPLIGTAIIPMICEHKSKYFRALIPVKNCYAVRESDFTESLISYELLRKQNSRHQSFLQSNSGGLTHYMKVLDTDGNSRKVHIASLGGRWWLPCTEPELNEGKEFTGTWCNSMRLNRSVGVTQWANSLDLHQADQGTLYRIQGGEQQTIGEKWKLPNHSSSPESIGGNYTKSDAFRARRIDAKYDGNDKTMDEETKYGHEKVDARLMRPGFIVEEEDENSDNLSTDSGARKSRSPSVHYETKGDDQPEDAEAGGTLPTYKVAPIATSIASVDDQVKESINRAIAAIAASAHDGAKASIKYGNRTDRKEAPKNATFRPTRDEVHAYLCHSSYNVCEKSANHWSNTVVRGPRSGNRSCDTCNMCNDRKGPRRNVNMTDDAQPDHCGKIIQFDLQTWTEPSMGGEKVVLRGIENHFGLAFATYHMTKGTAEIIQGAEHILDQFDKMSGGAGEVETIICDVEGALISDEFQEICKSRRIKLLPHTASSPEDTGMVERLNQTINGMRKACLHDSKSHDAFRMIADQHCMKVRNSFMVSGARPAPPLTCSTGRATSPKFLHPWFSDVWGLDTHRLAKHGVVKDDTTRTRGYYVGFDTWGILVFDPLSGNIIRCGRRQYIIKERFKPRDAMPLDVTVYEADPCNFQRPDTRLNKGKTVSAWAQDKIPWTLLSPEERRRVEITAKRSKEQLPQFKSKRDINPQDHRKHTEAVVAVSEMLQKRAVRLRSDELKLAAKMVREVADQERLGTRAFKRERYPDNRDGNGESKSTDSSTMDEPVRRNVPIDKSLIGKPVTVFFDVDKCWYQGIVTRSWKNAIPETLYKVEFEDGDTEDYKIDEIQSFVQNFNRGQRATNKHRTKKISKSAKASRPKESSDAKATKSTKASRPKSARASRPTGSSDAKATKRSSDAKVTCKKGHMMKWADATKNTWCDNCDENIGGQRVANCRDCDHDYCQTCVKNIEQIKQRSSRGTKANEFNMANAVEFDLDIITQSNDEEWETMEEHIVYKNFLMSTSRRRFTDERRFGVNARNQQRNKKYKKRCTKFINAILADPDAPTARECLNENNADYDLWLASTMKEVGGVMKQALQAIPLDSLTIEQRKRLMRSKLVMRVKRDQYGNIEKRKVRMVAMGNTSVKGVTHDWTHAPGASPVSMRALVALACKLRKVISSYDLEQCYLQAPINQPSAKDLFLYPPRELIFRDKMGRPMVFKCTSNLYGLASGGADSFAHVDKHMITEQGLVASRGDPCLYAYRSEGWTPHSHKEKPGQFLFHSLYTDDGIYFGSPEAEKTFEEKLNKGFNVRINSVCKFILGMRLEQLMWDDAKDEKRELPDDLENQMKLSQRAFQVDIIRIVPERMYLHDNDKTDSDETGAPVTKDGELPDFNAKTVLQPGAPRSRTPLTSENSKILDESFAATVKLLKEEGLLSENIVFTEIDDSPISGGLVVELSPEQRQSKADPRLFRPATPEEEEELRQLVIDYPYRTLVAKINYLARMTRPDLSHSVGVLSRHLDTPGIQAYRALKSVCVYILNTLDRGLIYHENSTLTVPRFYVDANFPFGRARGGYVAMYMGASIDWASKLAASAAASTAEAEIQAAFAGFCKALATKKDLNLLGILNPDDPVDFEEDSQAALLNLTGEVLNGGSMKWIANKFLKSIEWVKAKLIRVHKCDTRFMWADGLTKQLPLRAHNIFVHFTMGCSTK